MILIEVRINKEVRDYQESVFFSLSLRQFIFALLAVLVAVGVYFGLRSVVSSGEIGWRRRGMPLLKQLDWTALRWLRWA